METWILLYTVWVLTNGDFKAEETRAEFPSIEECADAGREAMNKASEQGSPATFFCFKKGLGL